MACGTSESGLAYYKRLMNFGYLDPNLSCKKVYVGLTKNVRDFGEEDTVIDDVCLDHGVVITGSQKNTYKIGGELYVYNNELLDSVFYGESSLEITTGTPVAVAGETKVVGANGVGFSTLDGQYVVPLSNYHYVKADGFVPGDLVVTNGGTVMVEGVDFELTRYNEFPAIITLVAGGISDGDELSFDYTYTPADSICDVKGGEHVRTTRDWFLEENVTGDSVTEKSTIKTIFIYDAKIGGQFANDYQQCDAGEIVGSEFELTSQSYKAITNRR